MPSIHRTLGSLAAAAVLGGGVVSCFHEKITEPPIGCETPSAGYYIAFGILDPLEPFGPEMDVGQSIDVQPGVFRILDLEPTFNPQDGWSCRVADSAAVNATITLVPQELSILELLPSGLVRGVGPGLGRVDATSVTPAAANYMHIRVR